MVFFPPKLGIVINKNSGIIFTPIAEVSVR
jgi:hypothetical protein